MSNEVLLIISLFITYSMVIVFYKLLGKTGLYVWTAIATIAANIEVLILVNAFGMEQTLGNILFASTFLVTDILSEIYGKKVANKAVKVGIITSLSFVVISQSWLLYTPNSNDFIMPHIQNVFSSTPRTLLVGILVYAIAQTFDVWLYHAVWEKTDKFFANHSKGLWIRNNCSTLISQLINTFLFSFGAFYGIHDIPTVFAIMFSSYIIYVITSILDTPFVYLARKLKHE